MNMSKTINGAASFKEEGFLKYEKLFNKLGDKQSPETMFITCADSRVIPGLITNTKPGDLFVCRTIGNVVPMADHSHAPTVGAAVEYAVSFLGVKDIIICGHSNCGAMNAFLNPYSLDKLPNVKKWLEHAKPAVDVVNQNYNKLDDGKKIIKLTELNVIKQLENLNTYPCVADGISKGKLNLHGWVYDIKSGTFTAYDKDSQEFRPLQKNS